MLWYYQGELTDLSLSIVASGPIFGRKHSGREHIDQPVGRVALKVMGGDSNRHNGTIVWGWSGDGVRGSRGVDQINVHANNEQTPSDKGI